MLGQVGEHYGGEQSCDGPVTGMREQIMRALCHGPAPRRRRVRPPCPKLRKREREPSDAAARARLPDFEPLTTYRLIAGLGGVALLAGRAGQPQRQLGGGGGALPQHRRLMLACWPAASGWRVRRHIGWVAYLVNIVVAIYLCTMLYTTRVDAESLVASFVGVLICGMVMHRVVLVVVYMTTACALHIATGYLVADPIVSPLALTINLVLYSLFVGTLLCMQILARERRRSSESIMSAIFDQSSDALLYGNPWTGRDARVNRKAELLFETGTST
jgi:hypothetical protein